MTNKTHQVNQDPSQPIAGPYVDHTKSPNRIYDEEGAIDEQEQIRLMPLEGSAMPSIKDFLAMDEAAELADKKKKRKEKQKNKKGDPDSKVTTEAKVNRDYQRLKSFTDKRDG
ncbi:hypothetical protein MPER_09375 [Moniliophthora perniciosa FA553]|nr:hypothetical protein MPER_09375 [Moniliophthora perniciosa FA553]